MLNLLISQPRPTVAKNPMLAELAAGVYVSFPMLPVPTSILWRECSVLGSLEVAFGGGYFAKHQFHEEFDSLYSVTEREFA